MLVLSDIEILEHWLDMNSLNCNSFSVLSENTVDLISFFLSEIEVLSSGEFSILNSYSIDLCKWSLLDAISSECTINAGTEILVVEHLLWISSSILSSQGIKFVLGQIEIKHGENTLELVFGNLSLSKLIKINEKLLDSNSLHYNSCLESLLNISRVVGGLNSLLQESVVDDIHVLSWFSEVCASGISQLTVINMMLLLLVLWNVLNKHIFRLVDIGTELEVVNLSNISLIEVLSQKNLEKFLTWWNEFELLQNSSELLSCNMATICSIIILKLWLDENSLIVDLSLDLIQKRHENGHLSFREVGGALRILNG